MGLVYLPTLMVDLYRKLVGKYTSPMYVTFTHSLPTFHALISVFLSAGKKYHLAKSKKYFANLDFPEIQGIFHFQNAHQFGGPKNGRVRSVPSQPTCSMVSSASRWASSSAADIAGFSRLGALQGRGYTANIHII